MADRKAGAIGRASSAKSLGARDPRWDRNARGQAYNEEYLAAPLTVDENGKLTVRVRAPMKINNRGEIEISNVEETALPVMDPIADVISPATTTNTDKINEILAALRKAGLLKEGKYV